MRRVMAWSLLLLAHVLAWGGAVPQALVLADTTLVPVRTVAPWLGASVMLTSKPAGMTLTRDAVTMTVSWNSTRATATGKAIMLPAPACVVNATAYLPARALAGAFALGLAWEAKTATLTLTQAGKAPLSLQAVPFPRPACAQNDTLAGLTPGDHLALAVALWGNPVDAAPGYHVPGAIDYTFRVDPQGGINLTVTANGNDILLIETTLNDQLPATPVASAWLRRAGSGHHLTLTGEPTKYYGHHASSVFTDESGDWTNVIYRRGSVHILCTILTETRELASLTLARVTTRFPI